MDPNTLMLMMAATGSRAARFVYTASDDGTVRKLDRAGNQVWSFDHGSDVNCVAVDANGFVYFGTENAQVRRLTPSGALSLTISTPPNRVNAIAVDSGGFIYTMGGSSRAFKFNSTGGTVWERDFGFNQNGRDVSVRDGGDVYVNWNVRNISLFSSNGNTRFEFSPSNEQTRVAVAENGNNYHGESNGRVSKIAEAGGSAIWVNTDETNTVLSIAVDADEFVYVAHGGSSADRIVRKLTSAGLEVWSVNVPSVARIAVDPEGYVYSAGRDNNVRKLTPDGEQVWVFSGHTDDVNGIAVDPGIPAAGHF